MRMGRSKHRRPERSTQPLSDPKVVVLRPRSRRRGVDLGSEAARKFAVSAVTLTIIVLAGGYMLRVWQP